MSDQLARAGSVSRQILDFIYESKEVTMRQIEAKFESLREKRVLQKMVSQQIEYGRVIRDGDSIFLTSAMRTAYDEMSRVQIRMQEVKRPLVPAPTRNVFGPELSAKHYLPKQSMRPGADDFRAWPSRMN